MTSGVFVEFDFADAEIVAAADFRQFPDLDVRRRAKCLDDNVDELFRGTVDIGND